MKRTLSGSRAIITGASDGIGRALALALARAGASVMLVARGQEALASVQSQITTAGGRAEIVVGDITDPAIRRAAIERTVSALGGLDLLINNAGVGDWARFEDQSDEDMRRVFEVNYFAGVELLRASLAQLQRGNRPMVVNVASILAHRATARNSAYCASKFALRGFSESIRPEMARLGIDVLVVCPGATQTDFHDHVVVSKTPLPYKPRGVVTPEFVAERTLHAIRKGRHEIIPNFHGRLLVLLNRLAPRLVDRLMHRYG